MTKQTFDRESDSECYSGVFGDTSMCSMGGGATAGSTQSTISIDALRLTQVRDNQINQWMKGEETCELVQRLEGCPRFVIVYRLSSEQRATEFVLRWGELCVVLQRGLVCTQLY